MYKHKQYAKFVDMISDQRKFFWLTVICCDLPARPHPYRAELNYKGILLIFQQFGQKNICHLIFRTRREERNLPPGLEKRKEINGADLL